MRMCMLTYMLTCKSLYVYVSLGKSIGSVGGRAPIQQVWEQRWAQQNKRITRSLKP